MRKVGIIKTFRELGKAEKPAVKVIVKFAQELIAEKFYVGKFGEPVRYHWMNILDVIKWIMINQIRWYREHDSSFYQGRVFFLKK